MKRLPEILEGKFIFKELPDGSLDKAVVCCTMCKKEFAYHRSNSTLKYHLRAKHGESAGPRGSSPRPGAKKRWRMPDFDEMTAELDEMTVFSSEMRPMSPVSHCEPIDTSLVETDSLVNTHSAIMCDTKRFAVPILDLESFLAAKVKLRQEGALDGTLKANLEYATRLLDTLPAAKRRDVSMLVEGERQLVRFTAGTPSLQYTVRHGGGALGSPELLQRVETGARLTLASIAKAHFAGHRCRDDFESCMERAQQVVAATGAGAGVGASAASEAGLANVELKIACGELQLTYSTTHPQATIEIRPQRRVNLGRALTLEKVVEVKSGLERSGAMSRGLQACFQHLLANHSQYQGENKRVVLQSNGEVVEMISGRHDYHNAQHYIVTGLDDQVQSHTVQDIDLWEDE
ncbi:uncharacterized protein LOC134469973 [Engraulis encrasicolus]|uniref:uncharacterized protein LOC134469973 n=1 Tax=Engraulis encrasicolus TaxID=184585 RepID=UPI002FD5C857